jgi:hypothetical protein
MKEKLQEIYDGLKERLKSPFLLTFMVVWAIHNWEFVYAFVTFNSDMPYITRVSLLKAYLIVHHDDELLWLPLGWTFASIGLYFVATFFSEGINLIYSKWIRTWLYWVIDRNKLKTEDDYNELEERRKNLQELVFDLKRKEEDAALKLRTTEHALNKDLSDLRDKMTTILEEKNEAEKLNANNNSEQSNQKKRIDTLLEQYEKAKLAATAWEINTKDLQDFKDWVSKTTPELIDKFENRADTAFENLVNKRNDRKRFEELFTGTWLNIFESPGGTKGQETFKLGLYDNQLAFITKDNSILLISNIKFIDDTNLSFTKVNTKVPNSPMHNKLKINNTSSLVGTENETIRIDYAKVGSD